MIEFFIREDDPPPQCVNNPTIFQSDVSGSKGHVIEEQAKSMCRKCPYRAPCLAYAIEHRQHGIWGGTTERERRRITKPVGRKQMTRYHLYRAVQLMLGDGLTLTQAASKLGYTYGHVQETCSRVDKEITAGTWTP